MSESKRTYGMVLLSRFEMRGICIMNNTVSISAINIISLVILSRMVYSNNRLLKQRKKPFAIGIVLTVIVILAEIGTIVASDGGSQLRNLNLFCNVLGFMLTPFIPIILLVIFDIEVLQKRLYLLLPAFLNGILAVLSPIFGFLFFVDKDNQYTRGNLFFLFVIAYMFHLLFLIVISLHHGQKNHYSIQHNLFALTIFIIFGTFIQLVVPQVHASWHIVTLSLFIYYILLSEYDGRFDTLTGLYNRSAFENDIRFLKKRKQYTIIVMDINDFKHVNDTFGHDHGDYVLKKISTIIKESFDDNCNSYRIGGDEFYVLCRFSDPEKVDYQIKEMMKRLDSERKNDSNIPNVAYGKSTFHTDVSNIQTMLKSADEEMYIQKKQTQDSGD